MQNINHAKKLRPFACAAQAGNIRNKPAPADMIRNNNISDIASGGTSCVSSNINTIAIDIVANAI